VADARVAVLGTVGPGGAPHLVPVVHALEGDRVWIAIDQKPKRTQDLQRLRNLRRDPRAGLLVQHYEEDWSRLWWVRADGHAEVLEHDEDRARPLALLAAKYPAHRHDPPQGPVIAVTVERWTGWTAA
jgi:PPOX class probable F420-dependent enzyme